MNIPSQYQVRCPLCGSLLDLRELNKVLGHEWDASTGKCVDTIVTSGFVSLQKIQESQQWKTAANPYHAN